MVEFRRLTVKHCEFGTTLVLNQTLYGLFICGLKHEAIKECLIAHFSERLKAVLDLTHADYEICSEYLQQLQLHRDKGLFML